MGCSLLGMKRRPLLPGAAGRVSGYHSSDCMDKSNESPHVIESWILGRCGINMECVEWRKPMEPLRRMRITKFLSSAGLVDAASSCGSTDQIWLVRPHSVGLVRTLMCKYLSPKASVSPGKGRPMSYQYRFKNQDSSLTVAQTRILQHEI